MDYDWMESPLGRLLLVADGAGLRRIAFPGPVQAAFIQPGWRRSAPALADVRAQLGAWFAGRRSAFDLPLAAAGGTSFQRLTWAGLLAIPYGQTISYAELARRIGRPRAVRAAGAANGANPLPIVVPCHRVIGADGSLTGFAGGLEAKRWLLAHERRHAGKVFHSGCAQAAGEGCG
ncbi:MAG: methylated-DNA--[protein]-cysteine S-methyltransferase [Xanthomonadales bacterium]|nr:methylated-DNA--[protein]-cysteine S-methyltransferase [Xanthomonadales bacterium]